MSYSIQIFETQSFILKENSLARFLSIQQTKAFPISLNEQYVKQYVCMSSISMVFFVHSANYLQARGFCLFKRNQLKILSSQQIKISQKFRRKVMCGFHLSTKLHVSIFMECFQTGGQVLNLSLLSSLQMSPKIPSTVYKFLICRLNLSIKL